MSTKKSQLGNLGQLDGNAQRVIARLNMEKIASTPPEDFDPNFTIGYGTALYHVGVITKEEAEYFLSFVKDITGEKFTLL